MNSEEIEAVAVAIIELCLSVSQSVENSVKNFKKIHVNFVKGFLIDLETFLGLAMPN